MEKLEFEAQDISYSTIEDAITEFYDLGYTNSSNFMELEIGIKSGYYIFATKGSIEFSSIVGKKEAGGYHITICPKKISK